MSRSTVTYRGIDIDVDFDFEPGQKQIIRADPDDCQEGFDPYVEVSRIWLKGVDITALFHEDQHGDIADLIAGVEA